MKKLELGDFKLNEYCQPTLNGRPEVGREVFLTTSVLLAELYAALPWSHSSMSVDSNFKTQSLIST